MSILLTIFIFFIVVLILIFSVLRGIVSFLFGGFSKKNPSANNSRSWQDQFYGKKDNSQSHSSNAENKVFSPDEGEYVKFEELD